MSGWLAVAEFVARAPMETPPPAALISESFRRVRSTSSFGRSTSSFIRSRMFVPPARNLAFGFAATACAAAPASLARVYLNGLIGFPLLPDPRQLLFSDEAPRPRRLAPRVRLLDGRDDAGVGAAAADVAAHPLAYLVVRELPDRGRHVLGDVAHVPAPRLFEQPDGRAELPGRAVAALPLVTALLRAGQLQPLAQGVEQHHARVHFKRLGRAVDL